MDKSLQIIIEILTRKSGPDAVAELEKARAATNAAGGDTSAYDETLKNLNKTQEEGAHAVDHHAIKHQELARIVQKLAGENFPELGHAISKVAFGAGPLGAIFLILGGIEMLRRSTAEYTAKLEEMETKGAQADFLPGIETKLGILRSALTAQESYIADLGRAKEGEHGIAAELAAQLQLQAAITAARSSQADAEKTLAVANLTQKKAFGQITDADFIIGKGEIEKKFLRDKAAADAIAKQAELDATTQAAAAGAGDQPGLDAKAKAAAAAVAEEKLRQARIDEAGKLVSEEDYKKARVAAGGKTAADFDKNRDEQIQAEEEFYGKDKANKDYLDLRRKQLTEEAEAGRKAVQQRDAYEAAQQQKTELAKNNPLEGLEKSAADARAAALKNQNETTAAADKAKAERDIQDATREANEKTRRAQESTINQNTASELVKTPLGQSAFADAGTADKALAHAKDIDAGSKAHLDQLAEFLGGTAANQQQILSVISRANDSLAGLQKLVSAIEEKQTALESKHRNLSEQFSNRR